MNIKKIVISTLIGTTIFAGSLGLVNAQDKSYIVESGDTFWIISQKHGVNIHKLMEVNNGNQNTMLLVGQKIVIPEDDSNNKIHTVESGDTFWIISQKYGVDIHELMNINNATEITTLNIGDKIIIPSNNKTYTVESGDTFWIISQKLGVNIHELMKVNNADEDTMLLVGQKITVPEGNTEESNSNDGQIDAKLPTTKPYTTYENYTVEKGDNPWGIALKKGIPYTELLEVNSLNENSMLNIGDTIKIPVHNVPIKETPGDQYGEYLDWWTEAQYVLPPGAVFKIIDFNTGKSFMAKRTTGANHADVETLTVEDSNKMKEIWGGSFSWESRPIIIEYNGRKIAASAASMPHAGNDNSPGGLYTSWRSDGYGGGYNFDWVKDNGIHGVFDVHFANSTRHMDGRVDPGHQEDIKAAAGIK